MVTVGDEFLAAFYPYGPVVLGFAIVAYSAFIVYAVRDMLRP